MGDLGQLVNNYFYEVLMNFHLVRNKINKGLITINDVKGNSRFLCFKEKHTASVCIKHMSKFRSTYGTWPIIDLSKPNTKIKSKPFIKKRSSSDFEKYLLIETLGEEELAYLGLVSNTSFFYCHSFGVIPDNRDFMTVALTGQELDIESDQTFFISNLQKRI